MGKARRRGPSPLHRCFRRQRGRRGQASASTACPPTPPASSVLPGCWVGTASRLSLTEAAGGLSASQPAWLGPGVPCRTFPEPAPVPAVTPDPEREMASAPRPTVEPQSEPTLGLERTPVPAPELALASRPDPVVVLPPAPELHSASVPTLELLGSRSSAICQTSVSSKARPYASSVAGTRPGSRAKNSSAPYSNTSSRAIAKTGTSSGTYFQATATLSVSFRARGKLQHHSHNQSRPRASSSRRAID